MKYLLLVVFIFHTISLYAQEKPAITFQKKRHPKHMVTFSLPQYVKFKFKKGEKEKGFLAKCEDSVLTFVVYNHYYYDNDGNQQMTHNGFGDGSLWNMRVGDSTVTKIHFDSVRVIHFSRNLNRNGAISIGPAALTLAVLYAELQVVEPLYKLKESNPSSVGINTLYYVGLCADAYLIIKTWRYVFKPIRSHKWKIVS